EARRLLLARGSQRKAGGIEQLERYRACQPLMPSRLLAFPSGPTFGIGLLIAFGPRIGGTGLAFQRPLLKLHRRVAGARDVRVAVEELEVRGRGDENLIANPFPFQARNRSQDVERVRQAAR